MARVGLTGKQERFCLLIVKGETQSKAYEKAGYQTKGQHVTEANASRLANNAKCIERIAELRGKAAQKAQISVESLTAELLIHNAMAKQLEQISAATGALALAARLNGLITDQKTVNVVHHKPAPLPTKLLELSESEWKKQFEKK